jgi:hypothetical protein
LKRVFLPPLCILLGKMQNVVKGNTVTAFIDGMQTDSVLFINAKEKCEKIVTFV